MSAPSSWVYRELLGYYEVGGLTGDTVLDVSDTSFVSEAKYCIQKQKVESFFPKVFAQPAKYGKWNRMPCFVVHGSEDDWSQILLAIYNGYMHSSQTLQNSFLIDQAHLDTSHLATSKCQLVLSLRTFDCATQRNTTSGHCLTPLCLILCMITPGHLI